MTNNNNNKSIFPNFNPYFRDFNTMWSYTLEIPLVANQRSYQLPTNQFLKDRPIQGIFIRCSDATITRYSSSSRPLAPLSLIAGSFISWYINNEVLQDTAPLESFIYGVSNNMTQTLPFSQVLFPAGIVLENCKLQIATSLNPNATDSIEFTFLYTDPKKCGISTEML